MSTYYIENGSSGNQYYFDNNAATSHNSSQSYRSYGSPVTFSTNFTTPTSSSSHHHDSYAYPQQHQSVAGFSKTTTHQYHASPSPPPQARARIRSVGQQDHHHYQQQHHSMQVAPQQHHFQFDSRQQAGHPSGPAVVYQTPGAAQFTHRNVDLWTEGSNGGNRDHYVQAQRVSVRSVSTGSPTRPQDSLQHYYSQLTPEQHQQLLHRQQQHQQQQQQQQQQQSPRGRTEEHHVQRHVIQQQSSPPEEPSASHPVGIRSLMTKFAGPTPKTLFHHPHRSQSNSSRHYSSSSFTSRTSTTNTSNASKPLPPMANLPTVTYSALPKPREPPVNSAEYYQMQLLQTGGQGIPNIQQAAAPAHIQHHSPLPQGGQERFRLGSLPDHVPAPAPAPQSPTKSSGNTLSSLRNQYMHQTKETSHEQYTGQSMPPISRTIVGEDIPAQKAPVSKVYQPPQKQSVESNETAPSNEQSNEQTDA